MAGLLGLLRDCPAHSYSWAEAGDSQAVGQHSGKGAHWLCQDFTAQAGSQPDSPGSWEKGPAHFPRPCTQDLRPPTQEKRHSETPCLIPSPPRSPRLSPEPWWGQGPAFPPSASSAGSSATPHQARSEVLGTPGWPWGLDPDHKARDPPGISGQMLLAKPPGLQGPDRKPPPLPPCGFPAPTKTAPRTWGTASLRSLPKRKKSSLAFRKCVDILGFAAPWSGSVISECPASSAGIGRSGEPG